MSNHSKFVRIVAIAMAALMALSGFTVGFFALFN